MTKKARIKRLEKSKEFYFQDPWYGSNKEFVLLENAIVSAQASANVSRSTIAIYDKQGHIQFVEPNI